MVVDNKNTSKTIDIEMLLTVSLKFLTAGAEVREDVT